MEFRWEQPNEHTLVLIGYDNQEIAIVKWNNDAEVWELSSEWIGYSSDISEDFKIDDIEAVKIDALEQLKESCNDYIEWYKGQIDMIEELYQDIFLTSKLY